MSNVQLLHPSHPNRKAFDRVRLIHRTDGWAMKLTDDELLDAIEAIHPTSGGGHMTIHNERLEDRRTIERLNAELDKSFTVEAIEDYMEPLIETLDKRQREKLRRIFARMRKACK